ncbi:MAG: DUF1573 domain-containing protein [Planctomycetota bacterium]
MRNAIFTILFSAAVGAAAGTWLAYRDTGPMTTAFYPSPTEAEGPSFGGATPPSAVEPAPAATPPINTVTEAPTPHAEVDSSVHDFGTMIRGGTESHDFVVTNTGAAPLSLEMGSTSCKCTLSDAAISDLAPGESTTVTLTWVAKVNAGPFRQTANVLTNDPRHPRLVLSVEGQVTDVTGMKPREFLVGKVNAADTVEASVYLGSYEDTPIAVTAAMSNNTRNPDLYQVSVVPIEAAESPLEGATSAVRIDLVAGPGLPLGGLTEWVEIETNLEGAAKVLAPVVGAVEGDISLHGRGWNRELGVLNFGTIPSAEGATAKLLVSFKGDTAADAAIEIAETDPAWIVAQAEPPRAVSETKTHIPLTLRIPPGQAPAIHNESGQGIGDAHVVLKTNNPETPEVDVRLRFIIAQ